MFNGEIALKINKVLTTVKSLEPIHKTVKLKATTVKR